MLHQIHAALHHQRTALLSQSYALSGLGGIGKTQTALEYAYRYGHTYTAVFWISAETTESLFSSFVALAELLHLPEKEEREQRRMVAAVLRWLTDHDGWLLIYDNVDDPALVKGFLPATRAGSLLFTTRQRALGLAAHTLVLDTMSVEEGHTFLLRRAGLLDLAAAPAQLAASDEAAACAIVAALSGLPLALDQAGAYLQATQCRLADYLHLLQAAPLRLLGERAAHTAHPLSVTQTFSLLFERLAERHPAAADLLTACAFMAPEAIPEEFFLEAAAPLGSTLAALAADPFQLQAALQALLSASLLQRHAATRTLSIHRLVQMVLQGRLSEDSQCAWRARVRCAMSRLFPAEEHTAEYVPVCNKLLPHALVCLAPQEQQDEAGEDLVARLTLLTHVGSYLTRRAHYAEAEAVLQQARQLGEQALEAPHPLVAEALHALADLAREQGQYAAAESRFQQALHLWEQTLGLKDRRAAASLNGLAIVYLEQSQFAQAEALFQRALFIREHTLGAGHPLVAKTLNGLANLYKDQGQFERAETLYQRIVCLREQALGSEHPLVAEALNNLALLFVEQGKYQQAEPLYQRALATQEQVWGPEHPKVAYPLLNLASLYKAQGHYEQAEPLLKQALHIREQALFPEHPQVAVPLNNLAELYRAWGKETEAEPLYQRAFGIWEQALGPEHPLVAHPLQGLADLARRHHHDAEAAALYARALHIRERAIPTHPDTAETLAAFALLRQAQGNLQEAAALYQRALAIYQQVLGRAHPKTEATRTKYTELLRAMEQEAGTAHTDPAQTEGAARS